MLQETELRPEHVRKDMPVPSSRFSYPSSDGQQIAAYRWDPAGEKFVDDAEANQRLVRPRRQGFELPPV